MSFYLDMDPATAERLLNTAETDIPRVMPDAGLYLSNAVQWWRMLDASKAAQLEHLICEELRPLPGETSYRLRPDQVQRLISLLQGIEFAAVGKLVAADSRYVLLDSQVAYVNRAAPGFAVRTDDGNGKTIYVLDRLTEIEWLCAFLETARELGVDVIQG